MRRFSLVLVPAFLIFAVGSEATVPQDPELKVNPSSLKMIQRRPRNFEWWSKGSIRT